MHGKRHTEETKRKISSSLMGHKGGGWSLSEETKNKQGAAKRGIPKTEEHKRKISEALKGKKLKKETCIKMGASRTGDKNPSWKGGKSFEPYCPKFNERFKNKVRGFYGNRCAICGISKEENGRNLHVHHVDYNKQTCCDGSKPRFVALCDSCHSKTNHNRSYWRSFFVESKLFTA